MLALPGSVYWNRFDIMDLKPRLSRDGSLTATSTGWHLQIPSGPANRYRLSQLDDHPGLPRPAYPWHPPLNLSARARVSSASMPGTWGVGLWNDPFGFSFGPGDSFLRLPALPNAAWFFYGSTNNYLSFRNDKPGNGLLAQTFCSPGFHPLLLRAGLTLPFSRIAARRLLSRIIDEDSARIGIDPTHWHAYRLEWKSDYCTFWVDNAPALESPISPRPPLGLVIWIDNQYAAFTPQGKLKWGLEKNPESAWLEIEDIEMAR